MMTATETTAAVKASTVMTTAGVKSTAMMMSPTSIGVPMMVVMVRMG